MKTYGAVAVYFHTYLISTIYGGEWSASSPGPFTRLARVAYAHWIDSWVSPRAVNRKISYTYRKLNPNSSVFHSLF
jgi:hypothetical protein